MPPGKVRETYRTAIQLKMDRAAAACANFLKDKLTPANCLGMGTMYLQILVCHQET